MATRALFPTFYDEETKIWSGLKKRPIYHPNCNLGQVVFATLRNWPNQVTEIHHADGRQVTNAEIRQWATRLAIYFSKEQLTQTDIIGIIGRTSFYISALTAACLFQATPFHAVNVTRDASVVKPIFENTKPKIMFCDGADYERIKDITKAWSPKIVTLTDHIEGVTSIEELLKPTPEEYMYQPAALDTDGDQTAAILCSSGTAGFPKCVAISHSQIANTTTLASSEDVLLSNASLDWATGFFCIILGLNYGIKRVIYNGAFDGDTFIKMIQQHKVTALIMAPWQAYALFTSPLATEESLATVRVTFITGGWISTKVLQLAQSLMKKSIVTFCYATTETGGVAVNMDHRLESSVGRLFPGIRVRITDDAGNNLPPNEIGSVLIDIGNKWHGYVNNPEDTAATIKDGWMDLGDLGYFDKDNNLYLVDRKKDLLKYNSKHYWPNEIEQIIAELPEVLDVCVVGVRDAVHGDSAGALIIKRPGAEISAKQIIDHVAERVVVDYKQLNSGVQFVAELPKNVNGKVVRNEARQLFEAHMNR